MKKAATILVLLFALVFIAPLGFRPMFQPDETRYAEIAREMLESGDWTVPHLNGLRYFEKPVFGYWLYAGSMKVFGENAFALRFPCALAAGIAALSLFLLLRRYAGGYATGLVAAGIFLTMPFVFIMGNLGILDSILACLLTVALCLLYCALMEREFSFRKIVCLLGCGALCGFAFLTKGFLAFAVPALTVLAFLIWEKRWKDLLLLPWLPAIAAVAVALPWALEMHKAEPGYWHYFFWIEHIQRFFSKAEAQHSEPFWFFLPILIGGAATWIFLAPAGLIGLKEAGTKNPIVKYCICWLALPFIFFSLSHGKLPPYILPCYAPLAALFAIGLLQCHRKGMAALQIGILPIAFALALAIPLFALNQATGFPITLYLKGETLKWIVAAFAALFWLGALLAALREKDLSRKIALFCVGPAAFFVAFNFIIPERILESKAPDEFLKQNASLVDKSMELVSWRDPAQSVCWTFKRDNVWLYLSGGEMDDGLKFPDASHRLLDNAKLSALIAERKGKGGVALVVPADVLADEKDKLPEPSWSKKYGQDDDAYVIQGWL